MSNNEKDTSRMFRTKTVTRRAYFAAAALPYYLAAEHWRVPERQSKEEWAAEKAYLAADEMMDVAEFWEDWDEGSDE